MKAVVPAFNQEKALVGAFSVITNLRMELFEALVLVVVVVMTTDGRCVQVTGLALSPDCSQLASCSWDGTVAVWSLGPPLSSSPSHQRCPAAGVLWPPVITSSVKITREFLSIYPRVLQSLNNSYNTHRSGGGAAVLQLQASGALPPLSH